MQVYQITCSNHQIRDEVVERCKNQEGSRVLFSGRDDEGGFVIIHAITGPAMERPAVEYHGRWGFPDLKHESIEDYIVEASIKITGRY